MEKRTAFVFPAQAVGLINAPKEFEDFPVAKDIFTQAAHLLPGDIFALDESSRQKTANAQPAILLHSIAAGEILLNLGYKPDVVTGPSLGVYAALYFAKVLPLADVLPLVIKRGQLMQAVCDKRDGAMAAIIGLEYKTIFDIVAAVSRDEAMLRISNVNTPTEIVIAGDRPAVLKGMELAKEKYGAKKTVLLPTSGAYHTCLMYEAGYPFDRALLLLYFDDPKTCLLIDEEYLTTGGKVRKALLGHITRPVNWEGTLTILIKHWQVKRFFEVGPGEVLAGHIRRMAKHFGQEDVEVISVGTREDIEKLRK